MALHQGSRRPGTGIHRVFAAQLVGSLVRTVQIPKTGVQQGAHVLDSPLQLCGKFYQRLEDKKQSWLVCWCSLTVQWDFPRRSVLVAAASWSHVDVVVVLWTPAPRALSERTPCPCCTACASVPETSSLLHRVALDVQLNFSKNRLLSWLPRNPELFRNVMSIKTGKMP